MINRFMLIFALALSVVALGFYSAEQFNKIEPSILEAPICSASAALDIDENFMKGHEALSSGNWTGAINAFQLAYLRDPGSPIIQTNIGFAYEQIQELELAIQYYLQALVLNSNQRRARERLGTIFLSLNDLPNATFQLEALKKVCILECEEEVRLNNRVQVYLNRLGSTH